MFDLSTIVTLSIFIVNWLVYAWLVDYSRWSKDTLSNLVNKKRIEWLKVASERANRIVDSTILIGQMNGALFYASSSLLALGACFAMLINKKHIVNFIFITLNQTQIDTEGTSIEIKIIALMLIFAYSFFKFGWAFRLFTYCSVLIGSIPKPPETDSMPSTNDLSSSQAALVNIQAAKHFDRGQRSIFFSLPLLGWFAGDHVMIIGSIIITLAMLRRQLLSQPVFILK